MADTKTIMTDVEGRMQRAIDHLEEELNNVRAGKASPNVLNGVMVDYYGSGPPYRASRASPYPMRRRS